MRCGPVRTLRRSGLGPTTRRHLSLAKRGMPQYWGQVAGSCHEALLAGFPGGKGGIWLAGVAIFPRLSSGSGWVRSSDTRRV